MNFPELYWVSHQLGMCGDTLCCFFNMHTGRLQHYRLVRGRARCSVPGILLNWAWYYPRWYATQKKDGNLYKQLFYVHGQKQFSQAHFFNRENELLDLFPGSKVITLLARRQSTIHLYNRWAHFKLLDKQLYRAWYHKHLINFPIRLAPNRHLANHLFDQGLTVGQYRTIAYMDWHGLIIDDLVDNPMAFWQNQPYITNFQENLNTMQINNDTWYPSFDSARQISVFIDQLADPESRKLDNDYYLELCNRLGLVADLYFYHEFWNHWFANQPPPDYMPNLSWPSRLT